MKFKDTAEFHSDPTALFFLNTALIGFVGAGAVASFAIGVCQDVWVTFWEEVAYHLRRLFEWFREMVEENMQTA